MTTLHREIEAASVLKGHLADILATDPDFLADAIEGETSLFEAIDALVLSVVEDEAQVDAISGTVEKLKARQKRIKDRAQTKRSLIATALAVAEIKKRETPAGTVSLRATPPSAIITEEAEIPAAFWRTPDPVLDKKSVLDALKAGLPVPGATLSNGGSTVTIRS